MRCEMKNYILAFCLIALVCILVADTNVPAGSVQGTWNAAGSPYQVWGDISVSATDILTVESGVEVIFNGTFKLDVLGQIVCTGTEENPITFTAQDTLNGWSAIRFTNNGSGQILPSSFTYTNFTYGRSIWGSGALDPMNYGGAIWAENAGTLTFNHCEFNRCKTIEDGSAIYAKTNTNIELNNCLVKNCESGFFGGVFVKQGSANIQNCNFIGNTASVFGAALYFYECPVANVTSCNIINSSSGACGGIYSFDSPIEITNSLFRGNNTVTGNGGAIGIIYGVPHITNCTFAGNVSAMNGGAFWPYSLDGPAVVTNSIFWDNLPEAISSTSDYALSYCSMQTEEGDTTNIWGDPLFSNPGQQDYTLLPGSPCIDAGTPDVEGLNLPLYDLAGLPRIVDGDSDTIARIDMGCFEAPVPATTGIISGHVTGNQNLPLENATITVDELSTVTNAEGFYSITLESGTYRVTCTMPGYETASQEDVVVLAEQTTTVDFNLTPVSNTDLSESPVVIMLQNHPNPFMNNTILSFSLTKSGSVRLDIYNLKGQKVKTLVNNDMKTGIHSIPWDGSDNANVQVGNGIYLCRLVCGKETLTKRLIRM
jgi:hypothetical protein